MIDRLDITDEYSVKCDFNLKTVIFMDAALNISLRKFWKCYVLWFYLFGQWVPNETKGMINLKRIQGEFLVNDCHLDVSPVDFWSILRGTKRFISGVPAWEGLNSTSPAFKTKTIYKLIMPKYFTKTFCGGFLVSIWLEEGLARYFS